MKTLMIDVDDTIVDMAPDWINWGNRVLGIQMEIDNNGHSKNISVEDEKALLNWWKQPNLYDDRSPIEHSIDAIFDLQSHFNVFFCSSCSIEHKQSKINFLSKYFGGIPVVDTHHKHVCKPDYVVDDRIIVLDPMKIYNPETICVHKATTINSQSEYVRIESWSNIKDYLIKHIKGEI